MDQIFDYPFNTWEEYYPALTDSLTYELLDDIRPNYEEMAFSEGFECNIAIIQSLLEEGNDAQKGLDMFFQSMIDGKYSNQLVLRGTFIKIVKLFLEKGAVINVDILLKKQTPPTYPDDYEDAFGKVLIRGSMLKVIKQEFIPNLESLLNDKIGWDAIVPVYWEEMLELEEWISPNWDFDAACYKILKFRYNEHVGTLLC